MLLTHTLRTVRGGGVRGYNFPLLQLLGSRDSLLEDPGTVSGPCRISLTFLF